MTESNAKDGSEYVYEALVDAGVEVVVGLPGTQTLPVDRTVAERDEMRYVMARHETAVPHVAWGYYETSGAPAATLTVPGPGDTNAMHGLKNALEDCVPVLHVSPDHDPNDRGKGPIHELEPATFDTVVKENVAVDRPEDLPLDVSRGIAAALSPPRGPVRLGVPSAYLESPVSGPDASVEPERVDFDVDDALDDAVDLLAGAERPLVYVGGGARRSPDGPAVVADLAERLDAPVVATMKGKGVFPEDDPRFAGVAGSHLPAGGRRLLERADVVLALGTDFDGVTTANWSVPMGGRRIHVTLDPADVNRGYDADVALPADVSDAGRALLDRLDDADGWDGARLGQAVREEYERTLDDRGLFDGDAPLNTPAILRAVRETLPRDAIVTTDVGGFRMWAMQAFPAYDRRTFVTAGSWAGMGVGLPAAIGAALANPDSHVACLTGDGGLMMCVHELHTAAEEGLDLTVVVSNNRDYGVISKSEKIAEYGEGHRFTWSSPSYVDIAEGFGCRGQRVETADELERAVADSLDRSGVDLIDVGVRTDEPTAADVVGTETDVDV
jgi:acetolactate synthase-1/2/3 large subunit